MTTCFALPAEVWPDPRRDGILNQLAHAGRPRLSNRVGRGLGRLLPALICGEESAVLAFHHRSLSTELSRATCHTLAAIEGEERTHHLMLGWLRQQLPIPDDLEVTRARSRHFFARVASRDLGTHLGRIAELDSAVCRLLHASTRGAGLRRQPAVAHVFAAIQRDEARHVATARQLRRAIGCPANADADDRDFVRDSIVRMLSPLATSFEDIGVDPDRLWRSLTKRIA